MKKLLTILFLLFTVTVKAQFTYPNLNVTNLIGIPQSASPSIGTSSSAIKYLIYNTTTSKVQVWNGTSWVDVTAGQTLSLGSPSGNIVLSGGGGNVSLTSVNLGSGYTGDANNSTLYANAGFYPYANTTGSTNYPAVSGTGIRAVSTAGSTGRIFEMNTGTTTDSLMYFRKGIGSGNYTPWMAIASRSWINSQLSSYVNTTGNQTGIAGDKTWSGFQTFSNNLIRDGAAATARTINFRTAGSPRFDMGVSNTAESGSNAGSDWILNRYSDGGGLLDQPLQVPRATGDVVITNKLNLTSTPTTSAGSYNFLTRNTSTGVVEVLPSAAFSSGTYIPTVTSVLNTGSFSTGKSHYVRIGNEVTVTTALTVTPTATGTTKVRFTLPTASAMTNADDLLGVLTVITNGSAGEVVCDVTNDAAEFDFEGVTGGVDCRLQAVFTYIVK